MSSATRLPWPVLVDKLRSQVTQARTDWAAAQKQQEVLQASLNRVNALIADYQRQEETADTQARSMRDRLNAHAFIAQLNAVSSRVNQELAQATKVAQQVRLRLLREEHELLKMQKLAENAERAERRENDRREQKGYDDLALLRANWLRDSAA